MSCGKWHTSGVVNQSGMKRPKNTTLLQRATQQSTTATVAYRPNDITHSLTVFIGLNLFVPPFIWLSGTPGSLCFPQSFSGLTCSCGYLKKLLRCFNFTCFSASNVPCQLIWCQCNCLRVLRKFSKKLSLLLWLTFQRVFLVLAKFGAFEKLLCSSSYLHLALRFPDSAMTTQSVA